MFYNRRTITKAEPVKAAYESAFENGKLKKGYRYIKGGNIKDNDGNTITKP